MVTVALIGWFSAAQAAPAMWHVRGGVGEFYLFGTWHALPLDVAWRSDAVYDAIARAEEIVLESDIAPDTAEEVAALANLGVLPGGQTWDTDLDPKRRARIFDQMDRLGLDAATTVHLRPWIATATVTEPLLEDAGFLTGLGVEMQLIQHSRTYEIPLGALETSDEVLALFADVPLEEQVGWFELALKHARRAVPSTRRLLRVWERGDVDALGRIIDAESDADAGFSERLLRRRNEAWIPHLAARLDQPGVRFVAVGAAHLAGEHSVVRLLEAAGYEVERVQ
jgi:uncharacterized protein YbaP (TraB family)